VDQDEKHEQEENDGFKKPLAKKLKGCKSKKGMKPKQSPLKKNVGKRKSEISGKEGQCCNPSHKEYFSPLWVQENLIPLTSFFFFGCLINMAIIFFEK
jgi:hypothetical protein